MQIDNVVSELWVTDALSPESEVNNVLSSPLYKHSASVRRITASMIKCLESLEHKKQSNQRSPYNLCYTTVTAERDLDDRRIQQNWQNKWSTLAKGEVQKHQHVITFDLIHMLNIENSLQHLLVGDLTVTYSSGHVVYRYRSLHRLSPDIQLLPHQCVSYPALYETAPWHITSGSL